MRRTAVFEVLNPERRWKTCARRLSRSIQSQSLFLIDPPGSASMNNASPVPPNPPALKVSCFQRVSAESRYDAHRPAAQHGTDTVIRGCLDKLTPHEGEGCATAAGAIEQAACVPQNHGAGAGTASAFGRRRSAACAPIEQTLRSLTWYASTWAGPALTSRSCATVASTSSCRQDDRLRVTVPMVDPRPSRAGWLRQSAAGPAADGRARRRR